MEDDNKDLLEGLLKRKAELDSRGRTVDWEQNIFQEEIMSLVRDVVRFNLTEGFLDSSDPEE